MKFFQSLFTCLALSAITSGAFAAAPAASAPAEKKATNKTAPATPPVAAPAPAPAGLSLDDYIKDLTTELNLGDSEKKSIEAYYQDDGPTLKNILNSDALSPLQQAQQVAGIRDARNAKIEALLDGLDRRQAFIEIEAKYRVALTELAANGGLVPAPPPAPAASDAAPSQPPAPAAKP